LIERADTLLKARQAAAGSGEEDAAAAAAQSAPETEEGLIVLTPARELKSLRDVPRGARSHAANGAWTVEELAKLPLKGDPPDRKTLRALLTNGIVVVSASLGGLDRNGLLSEGAPEDAAKIADANDLDETAWPRGFRLLRPGDPNPDGDTWKEALRLPLTAGDEDEPAALTILVSRRTGGERAGDPAISRRAQSLPEHGACAAEAAGEIADALGLPAAYRAMLVAAARAHDLGKARELWQNAMRAPRAGRPYAKTTAAGDPARLRIGPHTYRHEFGSLRDIEAEPALLADVPEELRELALHLVAAHHGFARPVIAPVDPEAATPAESAARAAAAALCFSRLQRDWGPWGLAWWEALLRAADWRASARNDAEGERKEAAVPPAAETEPA